MDFIPNVMATIISPKTVAKTLDNNGLDWCNPDVVKCCIRGVYTARIYKDNDATHKLLTGYFPLTVNFDCHRVVIGCTQFRIKNLVIHSLPLDRADCYLEWQLEPISCDCA